MTSCFGLFEEEWDLVFNLISTYSEIEKVVLFGSRAKNSHKRGSDVDLAIKGKAITNDIISSLRIDLEESNLPYFFDIVHYNTIQEQALIEHIDRVGKVVWNR
ncbi:nucleotidyltransferase domain-containing protein [Desulfobacterales bacterium HSG17]|nr:nucleotidyltransferase domain-containing protein [Desulfobacterales bacterium HSG17]